MKKYILIASVSLLLASCSKVAPVPPTEWVPPDVNTGASVSTTGAVVTGSGYDDKEVQDTMKEIDGLLSTPTDSGAQK